MPRRRVDVFFYGLFMDQDLLRQKGLDPQGAEVASVHGYALRIGDRATLVADASSCVHGVVMSLTSAEAEQLYSEPGLTEYQPISVLAHLRTGGTLTALCYNVPSAAASAPRNEEYATKLNALSAKVGLPLAGT